MGRAEERAAVKTDQECRLGREASMYTQGLERMAATGEPELAAEDLARSAHFQSRIDQEDRIEPND